MRWGYKGEENIINALIRNEVTHEVHELCERNKVPGQII